MTSDTSDLETPARSATSRIVGRRGEPATGSAMAGLPTHRGTTPVVPRTPPVLPGAPPAVPRTPPGRRGLATEGGPRDGGHRVPGAVGGGAFGGCQDLGHGVGVLDGGVAALAAGDGDQELFGLDDLEVVKAHGDPGAGLEAAVVAKLGVVEHDGIALVGAAAAQTQPQLVHPLKVPTGRAVGAIQLKAEPALGADNGPRRLQGPDRPWSLGVGGEADQGGGVVLVVDRAQLAVLEHREV